MKRIHKFWILAAVLLAAAVYLTAPDRGVPILAYHRVSDEPDLYCISPREFEAQMAYLSRHGYTAISLTQMLDGFAGKRQLPAKPVVITFDDGYRDNYTTALPIMEKYGMRGTVFMIASQVGLSDYATWPDLPQMYARHMEIGSHTITHQDLTQLPPEQQQWELADSRRALEQGLGEPVTVFAYPYGGYNASLFPILQQAGYQAACTGKTGLNYPGDNPFALKRISISRPKLGLWEFQLRLWRAQVYAKLGL